MIDGPAGDPSIEIKRTFAQYWDQRSSSFDEDAMHVSQSTGETAAWKDILNGLTQGRDGLTVLDVGTGTGFLAFLLAEMGHQVVGIDISTRMLSRAREKASNLGWPVSFQEADAERTGFPAQRFDVVVSRHLIWNLPHPNLAIEEWARVTKPGGIVGVINGVFSAGRRRLDEPYRAAFEGLPLAGGAAPEVVASFMKEQGLTPVRTEWLNALAAVKRQSLPDESTYGPNQRYLVTGAKPSLPMGRG